MKAFINTAHKTAPHADFCKPSQRNPLNQKTARWRELWVRLTQGQSEMAGGNVRVNSLFLDLMLAVLRSFKVPLYFVNQPLCIVNFFFSTALFQPFTKLVKLLLKSRNQLFFHLTMNIIR
ncbi:hypothetical protein VT98_14602 [Candidatus Electrothrix communis]|uniref:Uncharacterized protein n=1 Tax=Candidatus Electrothrix communis TaxID=1859133 RepID=A0A444IQI5_9BACT|nr:hypothetical protein VT98_14602 [Candidatus Electrothrix communis]